MPEIIMDFEREARCAVTEAVFCEAKSHLQIEQVIELALKNGKRLLLTRLSEDKYQRLVPRDSLTYDSISHTAILGGLPAQSSLQHVAIVSGGASDRFVCHEIKYTLMFHGISYRLYEDLGVAALWRLTEQLDTIKQAHTIIAVAGMEAALATVLAGLVSAPIIAVPTSVGYGVSQGGRLALDSCLGSCAPGLLTVNIDNGYGAACAAIRIINLLRTSNIKQPG